jgi:hypothetical protein
MKLLPALFLVLLTLKLCGPLAAASWWLVTAPLWGPALFALVVVGIVYGACGLAGVRWLGQGRKRRP